MAHQLTLELPDEVYQPLVQKAHAMGQTVEVVAQICLAEAVQRAAPGGRLRRWAGRWASHVPDASLRHDAYLGQALHDELHEPRRD
jgi:hypothetical protein